MTAGTDRPRLLVIANSSAGSMQSGKRAEAFATALATLGKAADVRVAQCRHPRELPHILSTRDGRRLVIAGGDGSLHSMVRILANLRLLHPEDPLSLLPLGTGNDLARTLGIPLEPEAAAEVVLAGHPRPLDLLVDDVGGVVVNAAHVGVGAEAGRTAADLKPYLGGAAYPIGSVMAGARARGWRLRVLVDDAQLWDSLAGRDHIPGTADDDDLVLMVGLGNGRTIGGGTPMTPEAEPDDGLIDVVVSVATGAIARLAYASSMRSGGHVDRKDVLAARGRRVSVLSLDSTFPVNADGEIETGVHGRTWHLRPKAWSILVPSHSKADSA